MKAIKNALENGELITEPQDSRRYEGATRDPVNKRKPVIVLKEDAKGRNEIYYDTVKQQLLTATEFIAFIESGKYPEYAVKMVHGVPTPVSNPDGRKVNNLG